MEKITMSSDKIEEMLEKTPRNEKGYEVLLDVVRSEELDIGTLVSAIEMAFDSFEEYMSDFERKELIGIIKDNLDPETIRLLFGDWLEGYDEEEKQFIDQLDENSPEDVEKLCAYLDENMHCTYGWEEFFSRFTIKHPEKGQEMKDKLEAWFDLEYLRCTYPDMYGEGIWNERNEE